MPGLFTAWNPGELEKGFYIVLFVSPSDRSLYILSKASLPLEELLKDENAVGMGLWLGDETVEIVVKGFDRMHFLMVDFGGLKL